MKLPNGYGSVYKNGNNRRKPYIVAVTSGWDINGKQIRKILCYVANRSEGLKALAEYHNTPYNLDYKNLKFSDVWQDVLKNIKELVDNDKMSKSNLKGLLSAYKNHCKPLHNEILLNIKYKKMQDLIDNSNLKYSGKGYIKTVCKKIFDYAINIYELPLQNNPAEKLNSGERVQSEKHIPFTDNEISILWGMQYNDFVKILLICSYGGERPNEIFITKKDNIHLDDDYLITGSKTEAGKNRIIPIHPKIKHLIQYFYDKDVEYPFQTICENFNYSKFSRETTKLMNELNFNHTPYDGRHTFITKMKRANANDNILKLIVGHSIQDITEKVYTHRKIEDLFNEIKKIN